MNKICEDSLYGKDYRLIEKSIFINDFENVTLWSVEVKTYKVQVKVLWFWITIKEFEVYSYDEDEEFCLLEAKELYNKIVNPYGRF